MISLFTEKETREHVEVMGMFYILILLLVAWVVHLLKHMAVLGPVHFTHVKDILVKKKIIIKSAFINYSSRRCR